MTTPTSEAEALREALTQPDTAVPHTPYMIAATICDTLGITRQDVKAIRWSATGTRAADALDALLTVAGR